jgi:hypothetical protein
MSRSAIVVSVALSAGLVSALPAAAETRLGLHVFVGGGQSRYPQPGYGYGYGYGDGAYRFGYARGYEDGFDHGKDDAKDRDGFNFWHEKDYRKADHGYHDHYGSRWDYQRGYRSGYEVAYRRAYSHFQRPHDHSRCDARSWTRELPRQDDRYDRYHDDRYRDERDRHDDRYRDDRYRDEDGLDPYDRDQR